MNAPPRAIGWLLTTLLDEPLNTKPEPCRPVPSWVPEAVPVTPLPEASATDAPDASKA